jgi:hypothetical protein
MLRALNASEITFQIDNTKDQLIYQGVNPASFDYAEVHFRYYSLKIEELR